MWLLLVLVARTQAFSPVSVQWVGDVAKYFVLSPRGLASRSAVEAERLFVVQRPLSTSPTAIPQFTFNSDRTITLGSMSWCVDAAGGVGRNKDEVRISRCNGKPSQNFNWINHGVGRKSEIQLVGTTKCLTIGDVTHADHVPDAAPIELCECDGKVSASWQLEETNLVASHSLPPQSIYSLTLHHVMIAVITLATLGMLSLSGWLWVWHRQFMLLSRLGVVPLNEETAGVLLMPDCAMLQGGSPLIAQVGMNEQELVPAVMVHNSESVGETGVLSLDAIVPETMLSGQELNSMVADGQELPLTVLDGAEPGPSLPAEVPAAPVPSMSLPGGPSVDAPAEDALSAPPIAPTSTIEAIEVWQGVQFWEERHTRFLDEFWQTRPLLIRQLFTADEIHALCPLTPKELLDIACEDGVVTSRLVQEDCGSRPWQRTDGPLQVSELDPLPLRGWSVLVNDVDVLVPEVEKLIEKFDFVPRWRIDDVMVSFAPEGGSIGAHCDNYDVFLLQGRGKRTWSLESCPRPASAEILQPDLDVDVLQSFAPNSSFLLEPGDALYVPPRYPHHGVSNHPECLTYSVGFSAPTAADLIENFGDYAASLQASDAMLNVPACDNPHRGRIDEATLNGARQFLTNALTAALNDEGFDRWMGETLTTPRRCRRLEAGFLLPEEAADAMASVERDTDDAFDDMSPAGIVKSIASGLTEARTLRHAEGSVFAFVEHESGTTSLFVDGVHVPCEADAERYVPLLCSRTVLPPEILKHPLSCSSALRKLVELLIVMDCIQPDCLDMPW